MGRVLLGRLWEVRDTGIPTVSATPAAPAREGSDLPQGCSVSQRLGPAALRVLGMGPRPRAARPRPLTCAVLLRAETSLPARRGNGPGTSLGLEMTPSARDDTGASGGIFLCASSVQWAVTVQDVVFLSPVPSQVEACPAGCRAASAPRAQGAPSRLLPCSCETPLSHLPSPSPSFCSWKEGDAGTPSRGLDVPAVLTGFPAGPSSLDAFPFTSCHCPSGSHSGTLPWEHRAQGPASRLGPFPGSPPSLCLQGDRAVEWARGPREHGARSKDRPLSAPCRAWSSERPPPPHTPHGPGFQQPA